MSLNPNFLVLIAFLSCLPSWADDSVFTVPDSIKAQYAPLYQIKTTALPDGSLSFGPARRFLRRGIHVLYLAGDRFEMAFQHGRLMTPEISQGALLDAAAGLGNNVKEVMGETLISNLMARYLYRSITETMYKNSLKNPVSELADPQLDGYGLSEGSGMPLKTLIYAALSAESSTVLLGQNMSGTMINLGGGSPNQCSSFVAWDNATADGEMLIGRNTDYWLNGSYDRFPTVIYYNPTDGVQKYMAVTSAGLHNAGVVGMNESGIYLDVHTIPTLDVSSKGIPVFMVAQEVLRSSKTFDEALAHFAKAKPASGWTYVLVSTREKKTATIELSNTGMGIRIAEEDTLVQTNHFLTPEMKSRFEPVNLSTVTDTLARYQRIGEMLQENRGTLNEKSAAAILGDKWDVKKGQTSWLGNTVGVHTTMTSAVVQPGRSRIFVGNGTAPVSQNEFVELPLVVLDPSTFAGSEFEHFPNDSFKKNFPEKAKAEQFFIQAKIAFEKELNIPKSVSLLEQSIESDPQTPGTHFIVGILSLRLKNLEKAEHHFKFLTSSDDSHYQYLGYYYLARLNASVGKRQDAIAAFQFLLENADPKTEQSLLEAANKALSKVQRLGRMRFGMLDLPLMFQQADMISYK